VTTAQFDPELQGMLLDRRRLLEELAPALRRVGPHRTKTERAKANTSLRLRRLDIRKQLRANAELIATRCMTLFDKEP
jgi:hypothetical protein